MPTIHKVETRDLAGNWRGCGCVPFVPLWWLSHISCTTKKALNEDQYEESGLCFILVLPIPISGTRTRKYVNGLPTNGFASDYNLDPNNDQSPFDQRYLDQWHRDPGCAGCGPFFAKKVG